MAPCCVHGGESVLIIISISGYWFLEAGYWNLNFLLFNFIFFPLSLLLSISLSIASLIAIVIDQFLDLEPRYYIIELLHNSLLTAIVLIAYAYLDTSFPPLVE
jgi:hypothetical protein